MQLDSFPKNVPACRRYDNNHHPMKGGKCVTPPNVNNALIESGEGYIYLGQHFNLKEKYHDKRYYEESWKAGRHTPNNGISSKATLIASG